MFSCELTKKYPDSPGLMRSVFAVRAWAQTRCRRDGSCKSAQALRAGMDGDDGYGPHTRGLCPALGG